MPTSSPGSQRAPLRQPLPLLTILLLLLTTSTLTLASPSPQRPFQSTLIPDTVIVSSSWDGLQVNTAPNVPPPRYLILTVADQDSVELNVSSAVLHISSPQSRSWDDVTVHCGGKGGIEGCRSVDLQHGDETDDTLEHGLSACHAVMGTVDGRALFDPQAEGCEPLRKLWDQVKQGEAQDEQQEQLLSVRAHLTAQYQRTARRWGQTHRQTFWLAHVRRVRASWPLGNDAWSDSEGESNNVLEARSDWDGGLEPNQIGSLFQDPYLPRASKLQRGDAMNGVDVSLARWNLGVSLRLPALPSSKNFSASDKDDDNDATTSRSTLLPVHAPASGQVVRVSRYTRRNAPNSSHLNDEQGWFLSLRDSWGFVWHLVGLSPYHQHVYEGQYVTRGFVVGHVSARPLRSKEPLDQDEPVDPPEKPPGGDGNPKYPFWRRELLVAVARPNVEWEEWPSPFDEGKEWQWENPLHHLSAGSKGDDVAPSPQPPPPFASPPTIYFTRPNAYPPAPPPSVLATVPLSDVKEGNGDPDDESRVTRLDGLVEMVTQITTFAPATHTAGLEAVTLYKLEWALLDWQDDRSSSTDVPEHAWRLAFTSDGAPPLPSSSLWQRYMAAMTSKGPFPWSSSKRLGSAWDTKARYVLYTLGGGQGGGGSGGWKTWLELEGQGVPRPKEFKMFLRATDSWGARSVLRVAGRVRIER